MSDIRLRELKEREFFIIAGLAELGTFLVLRIGENPVVRNTSRRQVAFQVKDYLAGDEVDVSFSVPDKAVVLSGETLVERR